MKITVNVGNVKQRNPAAYAMAVGRVKNAVHKDKSQYTRKEKHKKTLTGY